MRAVFTSALALVAGACVGVGGHPPSTPAEGPPAVSEAPADESASRLLGEDPDEAPVEAAPEQTTPRSVLGVPRETAPRTAGALPTPGPFFVSEPDGRPTYIRDEPHAPNMRYAALDRDACEAELVRRKIAFDRAPMRWNVQAPVWLKSALHGVSIHSKYLVPGGHHAKMEILGCRLVLALDDFSTILAAHQITEVLHLSAFRTRAEGGCTPKYDGKQHCAALAVDVAAFKRKDGTVLDVKRDFHGRIGTATCAKGAHPVTPGAKATELWAMVCEAARRGMFHVMLTPNYNAQHHNHLHLEITPDAAWMLVK